MRTTNTLAPKNVRKTESVSETLPIQSLHFKLDHLKLERDRDRKLEFVWNASLPRKPLSLSLFICFQLWVSLQSGRKLFCRLKWISMESILIASLLPNVSNKCTARNFFSGLVASATAVAAELLTSNSIFAANWIVDDKNTNFLRKTEIVHQGNRFRGQKFHRQKKFDLSTERLNFRPAINSNTR